MILKLKRFEKIVLVFFLAFVIGMSLIWMFEERFSTEKWKAEPTRRYKMVDDLIESQILLGKSKEKVVLMLGYPNLRSDDQIDVFAYSLGVPPSFFKTKREKLLVIFNKEIVENVTLAID
jgi:hypothetical protein